MRRTSLICAALLIAPSAEAAIIYQSTLTGAGQPVTFSDFLGPPAYAGAGSVWLEVTGGTITGAEWRMEGEYAKYWWELISEDDAGNQEIYLNGNEYMYSNGCTVTPAAPTCGAPDSLLSRLHNNRLRIDFAPPESFNNCFPFNGVFNQDCAVIHGPFGAAFTVEAVGTGTITLSIHDTAIAGAIPEPATWAMLIAGFGLTGAARRRRVHPRRARQAP